MLNCLLFLLAWMVGSIHCQVIKEDIINDPCMRFYTIRPQAFIVVDCAYNYTKFDPHLHRIKWSNVEGPIQDFPPYKYLKNGSLFVDVRKELQFHCFCKISSLKTDEQIHECKTGVTIIPPLVLPVKPFNETVDLNKKYFISCIGGGGDVNSYRLKYFINDTEVHMSGPHQIKGVTKVGCRVSSLDNYISVVVWILVRKKGEKTTEEQYKEKQCTSAFRSKICLPYTQLPGNEKSARIMREYHTFPNALQTTEKFLIWLLEKLRPILQPDVSEDPCMNRLMRYFCSVFYPPCHNVSSKAIPICQESCEVVRDMVCRQSIGTVKQQLSLWAENLHNLEGLDFVDLDMYQRTQVERLSDRMAKIVNACPDTSSSRQQCHRLNLDSEFASPKQRPEPLSNDCYRGVGRNYTGSMAQPRSQQHQQGSETPIGLRCLAWSRLPQLTAAFYQQRLHNQSRYCRNVGGIFQRPVCAVPRQSTDSSHSTANLTLKQVRLLPCIAVLSCELLAAYRSKTAGPLNKFSNIIIIVTVLLVLILTVIMVGVLLKSRNSKSSRAADSHDIELINGRMTSDAPELNILAQDTSFRLSSNKINCELAICPIYNPAYFELVDKLPSGAFGDISLVRVVIESRQRGGTSGGSTLYGNPHGYSGTDSVGVSLGGSLERSLNKVKRRLLPMNSIDESESTAAIDNDLILSQEKCFHQKFCWPYDKHSPNGHCPYAVIKYCYEGITDQSYTKFIEETKYLAQFDHPNIIRFYGLTLSSQCKLKSRLVEYLPNGPLHSALTGQPPPPVHQQHQQTRFYNGGSEHYAKPHLCRQSILLQQKQQQQQMSGLENGGTTDGKRQRNKNSSGNSQNGTNADSVLLPIPTDHIELTVNQLLQWAAQIADAVCYLHTHLLIHRDIAARNCLLSLDLEAKLSDFTLTSKVVCGQNLAVSENEYIPVRWLPPETLEGLTFNPDTDIWMIGVFFWEVMSRGREPYEGLQSSEAYNAIITGQRLEKPENCPDEFYNLMLRCWDSEFQRPSMSAVRDQLRKIIKDVEGS